MLNGAFKGIVVIVTSLVVCIAIMIVYQTFEKTTEANIFRLTDEIEASVSRTVTTEYRRYLILRDICSSAAADDSGRSIEQIIQDNSVIFGSDGDMSNMVNAIGYYHEERPEAAREYDIIRGEWRELPGVFEKKKDARYPDFEYTGSDTEKGNFYMVLGIKDTGMAMFFELDRDGFIDNYVKELVESVNTDFKIEWFRGIDDETAEVLKQQYRSEPSRYRFRPLSILFRYEQNRKPLIIEIPSLFELRRTILREDDMRVPPQKPFLVRAETYIKMIHEDGSYYHEIEHRAAINFLETVLIFIIIGITFVLLLFQLRRTSIMRDKEKEFVASVTHELRTPLTVIRSAADNLSTGIVPPEKLKVYGGLISEQSDRLANMIEEILLYSKFEDKRRSNEKTVEVDLPTLLLGIKPGLTALSEASGCKLNWGEAGLPERVDTHPEIITLAINNLVTNAVNHAYSGHDGAAKREIRVKIKLLIPDKLEITIEDDGRGIDSHEQKKIFDPFYRDNISRSRQEKGSGLGLFITQRKAVIAGGRLSIESPYRRIDGSKPSGCRFKLTLPCKVINNMEKADG